jgi:hypothetical protein
MFLKLGRLVGIDNQINTISLEVNRSNVKIKEPNRANTLFS